jgi:YidC/Oxa1 family membrane protein insertase
LFSFTFTFYLWIEDLTSPDKYYLLPIAMGLSMLIQNFFQPITNNQQKYILWGMPLLLTIIMIAYNLPSGLSLYIFANNICSIFQQIYIKNINK